MGDPTKKDQDSPNSPHHSNEVDEGEQIEENDLQEVIDLDGDTEEDGIAMDMDGMDIDNPDSDADSIINPPRDDAASVFDRHTGSIFCVAIDPQNGTLAATGGEDDKAFVWRIDNREVILECTGHKDSVTCIGFSPDASYVATADMGGLIQLWKIDSKQMVWSFEVSDIEWMKWHHAAPVLLVGTTDGDIWMWKLPSGDCKTFQGHGCASSFGEIFPDGKRACSAYEDGSVKIWDLKTGSQIQHFTGHLSHQKAITSLTCHHDNAVIMSGSLDGTAKLMNSVNGKVLATFGCGKRSMDEDDEDSVEAVGFCKSQQFAATGTISGALSIWDLNKEAVRFECRHPAGIVRLRWDDNEPFIYSCTLDGAINLIDARTGTLERQWLGHTSEILDMDISSKSRLIITGSGDHTARVFTMDSSKR